MGGEPAAPADPPTLQGLRVLVTRPAAQAEGLSRLLAARGAEVVRLPMVVIEPARQPAQAQRLLAGARDARAWIFTSVNAVRFAASLDAGVWPAQLVAVGAATAAALRAAGREAAQPLAAYSSEGVLQLPELQALDGARVLIVTGADGLDTLAGGLAARGARVETAEVYRRVPLPHPPEAVVAALRGTRAIILTSQQSLEHLWALTPEASRTSLRRKQLVVPSQRVVEKALELGFTAPRVPEQVTDAAFVRCLEQWWPGVSRIQ